MTKTSSHPAIGIDLGTTYSAVAFLDASGRAETIRNSEGGLTTPSAVFFDRDRAIVGIEAVEAGLQEPDRLALYAKRDVGEVRYEKTIRGESLPPEVLQALVLRKLKQDAELKLGKITKAVVTVPAFFNEPCRKATQDAGALAGLEVLDIINEPTAAAITYGVEQGFLSPEGRSEKLERVLVYDLGGGTFDVTLMEIEGRKYNTIATAGDVYLGGIDWDRRIVDAIAEAFIAEHGVDPREDPCGEQELLRKANQAKHALTQRDAVSIAMAHEGHRLRMELSQAKFNELTEDLVERTLMTTRLVLDDAAVAWSDLTRLILVGGSTRMPMIRDELSRLSGMELDRSLSPDEAVSHGAAIYAGILLGHGAESFAGVSVTNVNSHDLGVLAVDPKTGNPRRQVMIPRNSTLPARKSIRFRTHSENQKNVKVQVVEGGDDRGTNATHIGKCLVENLPQKTPKGTLVDVQFDYSQDGRLTVSAQLPSFDCKTAMTLNRAAGLSPETLQKWRDRLDAGLGDPDPLAQGQSPETDVPDAAAPASGAITVAPATAAKSTKSSDDSIVMAELAGGGFGSINVDTSKRPTKNKGQSKTGKPAAKAPQKGAASLPPVALPPVALPPVALPPVAPPPNKDASKNQDSTPDFSSLQMNSNDTASAKPITPQPTNESKGNKQKTPSAKSSEVKIDLPSSAAPKPVAKPGAMDPALADFLGSAAKQTETPNISINVSAIPSETGTRKKLKRVQKPADESAPPAKKLLKKKAAPAEKASDNEDWKSRRAKLSSADGSEDP